MKKGFALLLAILLLWLVGCSGNTEVQDIRDRGVLRVGVKSDVPGFGYLDADTGELQGMEIDLARAIAREMLGDESKLELVPVTTQTRGPMLDNGELDLVIATFTITKERQEQFHFTKPYFIDEIGFLVRVNSSIVSFADMQGAVVGVARATTTRIALETEAAKNGITFSYREYANFPEMKAALLEQEIDVFSVDKSILSGYLDKETRMLADGFNPQEYGIAVNRQKAKLAQYMDDLLDQMLEDGTMSTLIEEWGLA